MTDTTRRFAERLGGAFALATLLVALAGLGSIVALHAVGPEVAPPPDYRAQAEALRGEGLRSVVAERNFAMTKEDTWVNTRDAAEASLMQGVQRLRGVLKGQGSVNALNLVEQKARDLDLALDRDAIGATTGLGNRAQLLADVVARQRGFDQAVSRLVDQARQESLDAWRQTSEAMARARRIVTAGAAAVIVLAAALGLLLMRRFSREYDQAQKAILAREEFLSLASEELSRPLSALAHHVEPVREALHQPSGASAQGALAHHLDVANHEIERLETLIHELHEAARLRAGRRPIRRETTDLAEVVRQVARPFEARLRDSGSSLVVQARAPVRGQWDRVLLEEALSQVLGSAIRHGGGRLVKVSVEGGDPARVSVRNHGPGMTAEQQAHLFEAYDVSAEDDHQETLGLGLYIARQVIEEHGGHIRVVSNPGVGTLFTVELPRSPPEPRLWQRGPLQPAQPARVSP